jgi:hypothetical protein
MKNTDGFPFHVKIGLFADSLIWTLVYCSLVMLTAKWYRSLVDIILK